MCLNAFMSPHRSGAHSWKLSNPIAATFMLCLEAHLRGMVRNTFFSDNGRLPGRNILAYRRGLYHFAFKARHTRAQS